MVQRNWQCLWNTELQVWSLARHNGLRIWCHSRSQLPLRSDSWSGNSMCYGVAKNQTTH